MTKTLEENWTFNSLWLVRGRTQNSFLCYVLAVSSRKGAQQVTQQTPYSSQYIIQNIRTIFNANVIRKLVFLSPPVCTTNKNWFSCGGAGWDSCTL